MSLLPLETGIRAPGLSRGGAWARLLGHPAWLGLALLLSLTTAVLLAQALQARIPFGPGGDPGAFKSILVHIPLVSYLPAAYLWVLAGTRQRLVQLSPQGPDGRAGDWSTVARLGRPSGAWLLAGALGASLGFIGPYLTQPYLDTPLGFWNPQTWSPEVVWHRLLGLVAGTWIGWFAFAVLRSSWEFSRAARELPAIDVFDLRPLRPFAQQGLANGLLAAGMMSLFGLFAVGPGLNPMLILMEVTSVALVGAALVLPVLGVHRRIRAAKRLDLDRCEAAIERERRRIFEGGAQAPHGQLADLLACRTLLHEVREWPMDAPLSRRMVLYLLIPCGSWVASALVQHVIERAITAR